MLIIRPKQKYIDWINQHPDPPDSPVTIAVMQEDSTVYLIPEFDTPDQAEKFVNRLKPDLFEAKLADWYLDEKTWPKKRDRRTFDEWCEVEIHSMIIDVVKAPIFREEWDEL
jgi:hypothetical protein